MKKMYGETVFRTLLESVEGETRLYADDDPQLKKYAGKTNVYETALSDHKTDLKGCLDRYLSEQEISPSSLFMSAYVYMLRLYCGQKDVLIFAGESDRHDFGLHNTSPKEVRYIPVFVRTDEEENCKAYVQRIQACFQELTTHGHVDIDKLCSEYMIHPDCYFSYMDDASISASLALVVGKEPDGDYILRFKYAADQFSADTIRRMAEVYKGIVAGLCSCCKLSDICLADDAAIAEMDAFNETAVPYPETDMVSLFGEAAEKYPDRPALVFKDEMLTYRDIDDISDRIAGYLRAQGIGKGDVVSVLIPRSGYMVTASLGILKSGAAYQPLDPSYPAERLAFMIQDAACGLLIADETLLEKVPDYKGPVLLTKDIPSLPACKKRADHPGPHDLFILLYTSGTTGVPKGVMLEHGNLTNFCAWYRNYYQLDETCRVAAYASYGFDAHMMDMYPALTSGACLYIVEEEIRLDLLALQKWFRKQNITHAFMTTQVCRQFYPMSSLEKLQYMSTGGEKLVPMAPKADGTKLINLYGPTECTICTTEMPVKRLYDRIPIGKPLDNYKCYVADEHLRRLPPLVPGELLIAGRGVGRGYLNRPDLTNKAFIPNPFSKDPAYGRVYRTGDIVRLLPDGNIDFLGRNDGQVKVRGFRIELSEIENVIREFPDITDATVQSFEDGHTGEKYIAAYVVSGSKVDESALKDFIRAQKPAYMVPSVIMQIDAIPLNLNQKVNKKALPKPEREMGESLPPQNETQRKVFNCIADVVGHTDFGITTNIMDTGLSSIGALRLEMLLAKAFDVPVSIQDMQDHPTVQELADVLSGLTKEEAYELQADYPLTQTQNGILVESISHPETLIYNIPLLFRISGSVDVQRLKTALEKTISAHPYLNAVVVTDEQGNFRVRRMDDAEPEVEIVETAVLPEPLVTSFELMGGKLYRARIFLTEDGTWLFLEFHHIVSDGSSVSIFIQDLNDAYAGQEVPRETYTGFELALDEEKLRQTERYSQAKTWFDELLSGADLDMLPLGDVWNEPEASHTFQIQSDIDLTAVRAYLKKHKFSANAFYNAVFALVLSRFTGQEEALYTTIYNGRNDSRVSRTVTMMVKTFPVFTCIEGGKEISSFIESVGRQLMNSMAHDLYSFAEIVQEYGISADVLFVYQGDEFVFDTIGGEKAEMVPIPLAETQSPLRVEISEQDGRLIFSGEHRRDRFSEDFICRFVSYMEKVIQEFTDKTLLQDVCLTDEKALAELEAFNETRVAYPKTDIVSMFRNAAEKYPERQAVMFRDKALTYREVDDISDRIAGYLRSQGTGKGDVVSVLIPRGSYMATASLGVLKSGAAYQPLDPSYPTERLSFMMQDAACGLLIADESLLEKVPDYRGPVLLTKDIPSLPACEKGTDHPRPEDLFILLYTSGSTGVPKGVMLEHGNLTNFCFWYRDYYKLDETCRVAAYASYGFDACMLDLYPALTTGACVYIVEEEIRLDLMNLEKWYRRRGITHAFMTTQICRQFYTMTSLEQLRYLSAGGEKLVPVTPIADGTKLINGYGPTECTIFSATMPVDRLYERVPIGRPLSNYRCYVVDNHMNRLPPLVPGELVVAGLGVGRGYLNRPDLTEKAFIRNPFSDDPDYVRAYRTGDIVRLLPDGNIDFLGRNDGQVKVRGFRIELTEIERAVREFPGVEDATVQAFDNENNGEKYITAYVVSKSRIDESSLKDFIRARKPAYMVPSVIMQIDSIPLNQNQKVNKRALPKPVWKQEEREYDAPVTELQKKLCDMFAYALGLNQVGINENFFELGGTSLTVAKIAVKAASDKLPVAFRDIFDYPTVKALEKYVLSITQPGETPGHEVRASAHPALEQNRIDRLPGMHTTDIGDVLLTGATGFLGIHVLKTLLDKTDHRIYCLLRGGDMDPERRLKRMLMYYFSTIYEDLFGSRIIPLEGDITDRDKILVLKELPFKTVINCAACVKHFAADDLLDRINWHGVENLIDLCTDTGRRLAHISTVSVAGTSVRQQISPERKMHENELFFGQTLDNKYAYSKFKAEEAILNAIENRGLNGRIIRAGNLMARNSDGEFQVNSITNAFMRTLRAYAVMRKISVSMMDTLLEFSPIDCTAEAVTALSGVENFTVFHATNSHLVQMGDVIESMNRCGIPVDVVEEKEFEDAFQAALKDEVLASVVSPLITYQNSDQNMEEFEIGYDNTFTTKALYRLHVKWPIINEAYLDKLFKTLNAIGFFDVTEEW